MSQKQSNNSTNVVDLEDNNNNDPSIKKKATKQSSHTVASSSNQTQNSDLDSRRFWKAGDYNVGPTKSSHNGDELEHARVHPKFLHSNATSHKWAFGAIAELLDNAVDEIGSGATFVKVDKVYNTKGNGPALLFQDNGGGMDPECMRRCMSLGYSTKKANTTIGQYGNGFKTSTMRLGADVIVFSRTIRGSHATQSIGLLSYTFLRRTGQDDVIVPMVDFEVSADQTKPIIYGSQDDWSTNLKIILEWSPFASEKELMLQFNDIGTHGTKVIVYNLWLNDDGVLELDFDSVEEDIRLRDEVNPEKMVKKYDKIYESHISYQIRFSLRAYASILYLKKFANFQIILRGKPVQQSSFADLLKFWEVVTYRPQLGPTSKEVSTETTIGFVKEAPSLTVSGFNVYHKNRLIRPFWKVTSAGDSRCRGVVGFLEANFIEPAHDKQDFERSALFLKLETRLKQMAIDYWKTNCHKIGVMSPIIDIRNMQRESRTNQDIAGFTVNSQIKPSTTQHAIGLSANLLKEVHLDQPVVQLAANLRKEMHLDHPIVGLAANLQTEISLSQAVVGLAANLQKENYLGEPVVGLAANLQHRLSSAQPAVESRANFQKDLPTVQPIVSLVATSNIDSRVSNQSSSSTSPIESPVHSGHHGSFKEGILVDGSSSSLVDQLSEEAIRLFRRREEGEQKEVELIETVEELQRELEETKRKCAELALHLEYQRKQKFAKIQTEKA
ncbi:hypothetical protein GIB67_019466 [Kingdonia uniflora]|uniref:Morc S5 domain-containing protein n=1 Tax=Kingdonia uniflora TaxID=39325 RepID=A0A7J7N068_9MAGN|nr:hypothetical protein GIB67_019466 [Kingdonia uniflora]